MPDEVLPPFQKLLVANRSEIAIRVFRTAHELGIDRRDLLARGSLRPASLQGGRSVSRSASQASRFAPTSTFAGIVALAQQHEVDAIHPGYGFLSENAQFAQACQKAGIVFVGPRAEVLEQLGDKVTRAANCPAGQGAGAVGRRRAGADQRGSAASRGETRLSASW